MRLIILFNLVLMMVSLSEQYPETIGCGGTLPRVPFDISCSQVTCFGSGRGSIYDCPKYFCAPGETLSSTPGNLTLVFPQCCPNIQC